MIVGCYSLHLYCDCKNPAHGFKEFPHQFTGETGGECYKQARGIGWKLKTPNGYAICPKCAKASIKPEKTEN